MTILNFPASPNEGDVYNVNGISYIYQAGAWVSNTTVANDSLYVNVTGDKMTGPLEVTPSITVGDEDAANCKFFSNGSASFASVIKNNNVIFNSGDAAIWSTPTGNLADATFRVNYDGAATFEGLVTVEDGIRFADGTVQITAATGGGGGGDTTVGNLLQVCTVGNFTTTDILVGNSVSDPLITIAADGSISAGNKIDLSGGYTEDNGSTVGGGYVYMRNDTDNVTALAIYNGGDTADDMTASITSDGSITAAGDIQGLSVSGDKPGENNFVFAGKKSGTITSSITAGGTITSENAIIKDTLTCNNLISVNGVGFIRGDNGDNLTLQGGTGGTVLRNHFNNTDLVTVSDVGNLTTVGNITADGDLTLTGDVECTSFISNNGQAKVFLSSGDGAFYAYDSTDTSNPNCVINKDGTANFGSTSTGVDDKAGVKLYPFGNIEVQRADGNGGVGIGIYGGNSLRASISSDGSAKFNGLVEITTQDRSGYSIQTNSPAGLNGYNVGQTSTQGSFYLVQIGNGLGAYLPRDATAWSPVSSSEDAKDILPMSVDNSWDVIRDIELFNYYYKVNNEQHRANNPPYFGPMAHRLGKQDPDLLIDNEDGCTYNAGLLEMKALSALSTALSRIEELEAKVAALES